MTFYPSFPAGRTMFIVQLLLPLFDNANAPIPRDAFIAVRQKLTDEFGGVTAFMRSPAEGFWKDADNQVDRDDMILFEVMVDELDRRWWQDYKSHLEARFQQEEVVIRAIAMEQL